MGMDITDCIACGNVKQQMGIIESCHVLPHSYEHTTAHHILHSHHNMLFCITPSASQPQSQAY